MRARRLAGIAASGVAALAAATYLYHRASMVPEPMTLDDYGRVVLRLASDARESQRVAALVATGQLNEHYAKAQHEKLAEDVSEASRKLDAPPPQGRGQDARRVAQLARRMDELLSAAPSSATDRDAMTRLADEHGRIADELVRLAGP